MLGFIIGLGGTLGCWIWLGSGDRSAVAEGNLTVYRPNESAAVATVRIAILAPTFALVGWMFFRRSNVLRGLLAATLIFGITMLIAGASALRTRVVVTPDYFAAPIDAWYGPGPMRVVPFEECRAIRKISTTGGRRSRRYWLAELKSGEQVRFDAGRLHDDAWFHVNGNARAKGVIGHH